MTIYKDMDYEFALGMIETYQETHPNLSQDEYIELLSKETYPFYLEYHHYRNRNKEDPDLIISDLAFCAMILDA